MNRVNAPGDDRTAPDRAAEGAHARTKDEWRRQILGTRAALDAKQREDEAAELVRHALSLVSGGDTVCAYVPVGSEPGSIALLDVLRSAGATVLLPIAREPGALNWANYTGAADLVRAPYGLREPGGPPLGSGAIAAADLVLVPALAVDRRGVRLGRGAGFYDRSLVLAAAEARLVAVVRDEEVVPELPEESHDKRIGWALTPTAGLQVLGGEYLSP